MNAMSEIQKKLQDGLAQNLPDLPLVWYDLPGGLRGLLLEEESALRPLEPERVGPVMEAPPFWSLLWPSGERLCRLLAHHGELVRGRRVLDFGAGCGLVACAAAKAGALSVEAVDCDPLAALACRLHCQVNQAESVTVWERWDVENLDLFLAADFLYDRSHLELFEQLSDHMGETLVVDSRLETLPVTGFEDLGESSGQAIPDLERASRNREFGRLRFWYRGGRPKLWSTALEGTF